MRRLTRSAQFLPAHLTWPALHQAAESCTGCDLYQRATQTVFGEGAHHAKIVFVGEQPGDQEDKTGHPFVGPAGRLLDKALVEAGIPRDDVYITNAVKHFKWEPHGKRRRHKKPSAAEIAACRPWLEAELQMIQPCIVVCLGATAARSVFGRVVRLHELRGRAVESSLASDVFVTIHPSAVYRLPEPEQQEHEYRRFVEDLRQVRRHLLASAA